MENYYLKKIIVNTIISTGALSKAFAMQAFSDENLELTPIQFLVLSFVVFNDGLYQRQISSFLLKDRPNITRIINILEEKELVKRIPDTNSRKVFKIYATEKGRKLHNQIEPTMIAVRNEEIRGISENELETCMNVLKKIQENIMEKINIQI